MTDTPLTDEQLAEIRPRREAATESWYEDGASNGEYCQRCGRHYRTVWRAADELWMEFIGKEAGMVCPPCFNAMCEDAGITPCWRVMTLDDWDGAKAENAALLATVEHWKARAEKAEGKVREQGRIITGLGADFRAARRGNKARGCALARQARRLTLVWGRTKRLAGIARTFRLQRNVFEFGIDVLGDRRRRAESVAEGLSQARRGEVGPNPDFEADKEPQHG